jgi:hypothetical protein
LAIDLRPDFVYYDQVRDPKTNVVTAQPLSQLLNQLSLRWRRDWTSFWNSELAAGIVEANNLVGSSINIVQPSGLVAVRYNHRRGSGELAYQHMVQPNAVAASTFAMDEVALRGTLPFPEKTHLFISATLAYQHARQIDFATGLTLTRTEIGVVDGTVRWQPRAEVGAFLRVSLFDQMGHPDDGPQATLNIRRTVIMLGFNFSYPAQPVARVPTQQSQRVDRSDMESIPEPHSQEPSKQ